MQAQSSLAEIPPTLKGLVAHYSPSGEESGAVGWLVAHMRQMGFSRAEVDPAGNAVGVLGDGERQVVLLGHIDTVPGEIPLKVEDGMFYGRGSVDAKGPLAAFVDSVAAVGAVPGWQWVVIGAVDEEGDSIGARFVLPGYHPDFALIGEPSGWSRLTLGYKGSAWTRISIQQSLSHTAGRETSACEKAVEIWNAAKAWAEAFNQGRERAFDQVLPTLRGFNSGGDGFSEWADLRVGVRLPVDLTPQDWYSALESLAPLGACQPYGYPIPAHQADKNTPLVRAFLGAIRSVGGNPGFVLKTGTSDMNIVAPVWNCPILAYGPGDSALDHTPHEHISLEEYERSVSVLRAALQTLSGM